MKVAILLSVLSIGLAGFLAYDRFGGCTSCRGAAAPDASPSAALEEEVKELKARLAALETRPLPIERSPEASGGSGPSLAAGRRPAGKAAPTEAADDPIEKRLAALEEYKTKAEEEAKSRPQFGRAIRGGRGGFGANFYMTVDDAKADLGLTDQQKSDFDRIVADTKRDIDDIWKTPDDEGKTYEQVMADMMKAGPSGQPNLDFSKVMGFRNKTIPGRNETYGAADRRVRESGKTAMKATLSTEQQSKFEKSNTDSLFGMPGIGSSMVSIAFPAGGMSGDK